MHVLGVAWPHVLCMPGLWGLLGVCAAVGGGVMTVAQGGHMDGCEL